MDADDEGFVANTRRICRSLALSPDTITELVGAGYYIVFDSGVGVIKHWYINNQIRQDRVRPTIHRDERATLVLGSDRIYHWGDQCQSNVGQMSAQNSSVENRVVNTSEDESTDAAYSHLLGEYANVCLSNKELESLKNEFLCDIVERAIERLSVYMIKTGKQYANHYAVIRDWIHTDSQVSNNSQDAMSVGHTTSFDLNDFYSKVVQNSIATLDKTMNN
jgi:hypothetical protein